MMVKLYYDLIKLELRTINQVPLLWRLDVQTLIEAENNTPE